jgi:hypothetical protein
MMVVLQVSASGGHVAAFDSHVAIVWSVAAVERPALTVRITKKITVRAFLALYKSLWSSFGLLNANVQY